MRAVDGRRAERHRWPVGLLELVHAAVLGALAWVIPRHEWLLVAIVTAAVALLHALTCALALANHSRFAAAWRAQSFASLAYLAYLSWGLLSSAAYIAGLYAGLGAGVAAALVACWAIVVLFTLPLACWGIAATGGIPWRRRPRAAPIALSVIAMPPFLVAAGMHQTRALAAAQATVSLGSDDAQVAQALRETLDGARDRMAPGLPGGAGHAPGPAETPPGSLFLRDPARCAEPPGPGRATLFFTYLARGDDDKFAPRTRCLQAAGPEALLAELAAALDENMAASPIKIDVVRAVQPLPQLPPMVDGLALRPGLDGVCLDTRCLMPWQLVALDLFNSFTPLPAVPDFRFGVTAASLRGALGQSDQDPAARSLVGLVRLETHSLLLDRSGEVHPLPRMRREAPPVDEPSVAVGVSTAEEFILGAQVADGKFKYKVDPFTGTSTMDGFSVARQAGTTLVLCELGTRNPQVRSAAARSLKMLATLESRAGALGALLFPAGSVDQGAPLGPTALSLISFLSCRPLVGRKHDELIRRMGRFLLAMQRPDGGFYPRYNLKQKRPEAGKDPMYAAGQAVMALTLLEAMANESGGEPSVDELRPAVSRAMDHVAGPYWDHMGGDIFYLEENWHCLAARASLGHHRHDGYERFCIEYMEFKSRLLIDRKSRFVDDFIGGYGFGNVLPPHNTATAGYGEGLAAAMAIKKARGMPLEQDQARMTEVIRFLLRQQWSESNCFACSTKQRITGGFSEHMASPVIRIDYVQHAWAAMGHGARMLGLLPEAAGPT
jgi:hypothetical protein